MSKMFKCMCLLVMSVFCMSSISPSLVVFADDSLSANSKVVSGEAQFENGSSVRFGDTQVNILSDEVLEVVNPDGSVDTIERRADGVYINGAFYMAYQKNEIDLNISFRSYDPNVWNYVNTIHGNKQANTFANFMTGAGISYMIGRIGALLGGAMGCNDWWSIFWYTSLSVLLGFTKPISILHNKYLYPCCSKKMEVYH
ncbi:Uncharacterised protein [Streptococcus pneumoniae]|nr:Uncharacterised protein [Streptococcus pneumoniae]SUO15365.1 Uncharacterised protein [Streptococcus pneumoniae]VLP26999.1 Uncharacterised protein [Streptococcus pneumoniae]VMN34999.1 Uncharacterised protein [Streptococcus pneumoniae]